MPKCFLYSPKRSIIAEKPVATFQSNHDIQGFLKFAEQHKDKKLIGYLSYDIGHQLHNIKTRQKPQIGTPNILFYAFNQWQELNPEETKAYIKKQTHKLDKNPYLEKFKTIISPEEYQKAYQKTKEYIKKGEVYQLNLTHQLQSKTNISGPQLFFRVIEKNPVDYAAYIEGADFEILSASPEKFITIKDGQIETRPIKGTRPRGKTPQEDQQLKQELIDNPKEAAELHMITDLLRNDIGKISKAGSTKVLASRLIQKCPTVWHTYSKIQGQLKVKPLQALISMLPGGSITGCPKKRALEIIDELEPTAREIYTGTIGHIDPNTQNLDFSIAIRTIIKKDQNLYLHVGGGIVWDSNQEFEFEETLQKAQSFQNLI